MKKAFIISAILFGVTLLIWSVYNIAFKKSSSNPTTAKPTAQATIQPPKAEPPIVPKKQDKITLVSKDPVLGAISNKQTEKIFFYSALDGIIWQADSDGTSVIQNTSTKLTGLVGVDWSPDKTKVLTTFNKEGKIIFYTYDNVKKIGNQLKENLDSVTWDSLGGKIIYKYFDIKAKKRSLSVADPDGNNWKTIVENIPFRNVSIAAVPLTSVISFWNAPVAAEESVLQIVAATGGEVKNIFKGRFGADYLWSPDGTQALVSSLVSKNNKTITLGVINLQGEYRDLGIPTIVSKCAWSSDGKTVYYMLPGGIPSGAIMPDDYLSKKFMTNDTFWKVNVITGSKDRVLELADINDSYDVTLPFLSATENSLFFTNRVNGKLYRVAL
ncbi:MAG: WD40 repeat domain-containing protein [Candidatus Moraniibacteriota bacterium]|jgi:hypothetical protein